MVVHDGKLAGYETARNGVVYFPISNPGYLQLEGQDRIDFMQRQTSNDIRLLSDKRAVRTVLTSPLARIIDVLCLVSRDEGIDILALTGKGKSTAQFFKSHIFFMDKVTVADQSDTFAQFDLDGFLLPELLGEAKIDMPETDQVIDTDVGGVGVTLIGRDGLFGLSGIRLLSTMADAERLQTALDRLGCAQLSSETHEVLRVESGLPGAIELSEEYTPLEINLLDAVSDSKGCYTGQEIIARQITYDKVTRHLVGLSVEKPVNIGWRVEADGRAVGEITSSIESPRYGFIALAVIKRPHDQPGTQLTVTSGDQRVVSTIRDLPFE